MWFPQILNKLQNSLQPAIGVSAPAGVAGLKVMPEKKERDHWWAFLNGAPESEWNPVKKSKTKRTTMTYRKPNSASPAYDPTNDVSQYEVIYESESVQEAVVMDEYGEITEEITVSYHDTSRLEPLPASYSEDGPIILSGDDTSGRLNQLGRPKQPTPTLLSLMDSVSTCV